MDLQTGKHVLLIMTTSLVLAWGIAALVDKPWFRRFLVLLGLTGGE